MKNNWALRQTPNTTAIAPPKCTIDLSHRISVQLHISFCYSGKQNLPDIITPCSFSSFFFFNLTEQWVEVKNDILKALKKLRKLTPTFSRFNQLGVCLLGFVCFSIYMKGRDELDKNYDLFFSSNLCSWI